MLAETKTLFITLIALVIIHLSFAKIAKHARAIIVSFQAANNTLNVLMIGKFVCRVNVLIDAKSQHAKDKLVNMVLAAILLLLKLPVNIQMDTYRKGIA